MSGSSLFRFVQVELPWSLGPPDGRYLVRGRALVPGPGAPATGPSQAPSSQRGSRQPATGPSQAPSSQRGSRQPAPSPPTHVIVLATLGATRRRRLGRRTREAPPEPAPTPVQTGRATVIDAEPVEDIDAARRWLRSAGEPELEAGLSVLNRALHEYRIASSDPWLRTFARDQAIVARIGFGEGDQVADGVWTEARELLPRSRPRGHREGLVPQARLAATLAGRARALACEELALRARLDLEEGRPREASLQLLAALDAALAELAADPAADRLADRLAELTGRRNGVAVAAREALAGDGASGQDDVTTALRLLEATLRARAASTG